MNYGEIRSTTINNFEVSARYVGDGEFEDFKVVFINPYINSKKAKQNVDPGEIINFTKADESWVAPDEQEIIDVLINEAVESNKP